MVLELSRAKLNTLRWAVAACAVFFIGACSDTNAAPFKEGTHYDAVANPKPDTSTDTVSVVEFFSYGCPHCFRVEGPLNQWKAGKADYVEFKRMPAYWNPSFEMLAQAYYTAEIMKVLDNVHTPLFQALHVQRRQIKNMAAVKAVFQEQGVDVSKFDQLFNSFAVKQKLKLADNAFRGFGLRSVPSFVVGGKYMTDLSKAGSAEELGQVLNFLAKKVKDERR